MIFDVQLLAGHYAETFMFGGPQGVRAVKKEAFVKVLPRRKELMKAAGLLSSDIDSVEASALDSRYMLVKTAWNMSFRTNDGRNVARNTLATYILSAIGESFEIVFQLDHQDLMAIAQELRAQS